MKKLIISLVVICLLASLVFAAKPLFLTKNVECIDGSMCWSGNTTQKGNHINTHIVVDGFSKWYETMHFTWYSPYRNMSQYQNMEVCIKEISTNTSHYHNLMQVVYNVRGGDTGWCTPSVLIDVVNNTNNCQTYNLRTDCKNSLGQPLTTEKLSHMGWIKVQSVASNTVIDLQTQIKLS